MPTVGHVPASSDWLVSVVERASTLWERLNQAFARPPDAVPEERVRAVTNTLLALATSSAGKHETSGNPARRAVARSPSENTRPGSERDEHAEARLARWREAVGGDTRLLRRLSWDDVDLDQARQALERPRLAPGQPLPAWARTLSDAVDSIATARASDTTTCEEEPRWIDPNEPLPFEEFCLPFVRFAHRRLLNRCAGLISQLSGAAPAQLGRQLLARLARLSAEVLTLEFSIYRATRLTPFELQWRQLLPTGSRTLYDRFVAWVTGDGLVPLLGEYAVLARQIGTSLDMWVDASGTLLERLAADRLALDEAFGGTAGLGAVAGLETGLSDPHRGGRSVAVLTFANGRKVVYKPKDVGLEGAYFGLLDRLNAWGAPLALKTLRIVERPEYGWVEHVSYTPCRTAEEAVRYYRRAGMLLAVVHLLGGTDCHHENLIACGEYPVMVDLEALMHHELAPSGEPDPDGSAVGQAHDCLWNSVLRTGLLPQWQLGRGGRSYDVSGVGGLDQHEAPFLARRWRNLNTDGVSLAWERARFQPQSNMPLGDGAAPAMHAHREDLVDGFRQMYRFLIDRRDDLLASDGPLAEMDGQTVRFIFRPTRVYGALINQLLNPDRMRDGIDGAIDMEVLARGLLESETRPALWPLVGAEQAALAQLDVPYFCARSNEDVVRLDDGRLIGGWARGPTFPRVMARLRDFGEHDLRLQASVIRNAFYARIDWTTVTAGKLRAGRGFADLAALDSHSLMALAVQIASELRALAFEGRDGSLAWLGLEYVSEAAVRQLQPIGFGLYGGNCGIALFLAALHKVSGDAEYRRLALAALRVLKRPLADSRLAAAVAATHGIGGGGSGSIVYGLVRIATLLDEPSLLDLARRASESITAGVVAVDSGLDVAAGSAGAIFGLLALHEATGDQTALERAVLCGQHLTDRRVASSCGLRAWATLGGKLLAGFAHGASGIACALLRLHRRTGIASFREAAVEAFGYERRLYSQEAGDWPDLRSGEPTFQKGWCHGAPGIAMARLDALSALDTAEVRQDLDAALAATTEAPLDAAPDTPCCGILGRADALLLAGARLDRPDLRSAAERMAAWVAARASDDGGFSLLVPGRLEDVRAPGLFQGSAGVGYMLLRLARPDALPSFLLFE